MLPSPPPTLSPLSTPPYTHTHTHTHTGTFVTTDAPTLTRHYHPSPLFTLGVTLDVVHSTGFDKCVMTYIHQRPVFAFTALPGTQCLIF